MRLAGRRLRLALVLGAGVLSALLGVTAYATHVFRNTELSSVDARFAIRGARPAPRDVTVVAIDDRTFNELHGVTFPFPRGLHARVIRRLKAAGAKVIAYDVQFTEPSSDPNQDDMLIQATRDAGNVVLATTEVGARGSTSIFGGYGGGGGLRYSRGVPSNSNFPNDPGGVIRRTAFRIQGLETFPAAAARLGLGHPAVPPGGPAATPWIDYAGPPGTIRRLSFGDVLRGRFPVSAVRGRVVVVGATALSLQDLHPTSTTGQDPMPGPEIQANAIDTALRGYPLGTVPGWVNVFVIVVLAAVAPLLALRRSMLVTLAVTVVVLALYAVTTQLLFDHGLIIAAVVPLGAGALALLLTGALRGIITAFERERVHDAFARFVPESVVSEVLARADGVRLGGVRREGTVLFSDLRGFTSFAEHLEPDAVIEILNRYLTAMSEAILDEGGTLVAYMGDGIMAVFGAPIEQPDHAERALRAARGMLEALEGFNGWLAAEGHGAGFKMGIGINSGPVMSGNVGSERRLEYTAIGDTTNTAARLEGMTKGTPYQLFLADSTRRLLTAPPDDLVEVGEQAVRGRDAALLIWSLAGTVSAIGSPAAPAVPAPAG